MCEVFERERVLRRNHHACRYDLGRRITPCWIPYLRRRDAPPESRPIQLWIHGSSLLFPDVVTVESGRVDA